MSNRFSEMYSWQAKEEEEEEEEGEEEYDYMHAEDNYEDVTLPERDGSRSSGTGR